MTRRPNRQNRSRNDQLRVNLEGLLMQARTLRAIDIARAHGHPITDFQPWSQTRPPSRAELLDGLDYLEELEADEPQLAAYGRRQSLDKTKPTRLGSILTGASHIHAERIQRLQTKLDALE